MRKSACANFGEKDSDRLCVRGVALNPIRLPVSDKTKWGLKNVRLYPEDQNQPAVPTATRRDADSIYYKRIRRPEKKFLALNVIDCESSGVRNGLLRQIHETVQISDFRWLLGKLIRITVSREEKISSDSLIDKVNINAIYRDLNEYVKVLGKLASMSENESDPELETTTFG
ncbi:hypothetical protein WA026_015197 [Henosepilachna vigintioctopunctata]|uniref:Uncharacterized protein n=1 Tax=Henosepilachna vigintioctopunctata TaxID=420089 RepID=A0AAW1TXT1_9CUCU